MLGPLVSMRDGPACASVAILRCAAAAGFSGGRCIAAVVGIGNFGDWMLYSKISLRFNGELFVAISDYSAGKNLNTTKRL